jgi:predicted RNA-binding protein YlqC (UPF0109 family)
VGSSPLEDLITYLVQGLVDRPELVRVREGAAAVSGEGGRSYELQVAPEDVGKVIGRDGRTVNAVRTLVAAAAQKMGEKVRLEILDERKPQAPTQPPVSPPSE